MPEQLKLNDGSTIPQIGLGVWQVDPDITAKVVHWGIEAGYRLIDTAEGYRNEEGVGEAIRSAGVPRNELFITSKLRNGGHQRDAALRSFDDTMQKLGIDQIDLFLIHWPVPSQNKYLDAWKALVELKEAGRIKPVGVSNFEQDHLERIIGETGVTPAVNQIELHPRFQQRDKREFHERHNIRIESWSPLGSGRLLADPTLQAIAKKHGKSVAQVTIRRHLQEGLVVIPKSVQQDRIAGNFDVFDFEMDGEDMQTIRRMDSADGRTGPNPTTAAFMF
ncbi:MULTISPECIES: aldo/keto reductase [unclassified Mesorhizobium]|uniref:aldo/keto reductase n=1 Tax=unclassified Mesorhizobium TaxID=325217 RepID=UPI000FCCD1AD|nr:MULTISPECIES: aldo/keto reductase [unclassified Mesorhizobium]TGV92125.1 aldo/keto reductase [Mesorhizobium sp. M00.F.Ca.ET.158.01.1.1]RUV20186.1 aldo/keto reductase [Mesorhizobium sp. M1A.F.Ca.IN.022.04.1.1]RWG26729.1 MAG: aldo/keto reductase [Mesorhizobium sp.]TGQ23215.1 aldo/keto reductase [Mesorhizobium sp. M00.F.Ca.ET.217.01.1.1]TIO28949.1 MAG: aldo/keto reductase [Mesorhizobium sp.]